MDKIRRNDSDTERRIADVRDTSKSGRESTRGADAAFTVRSRAEAKALGLKRYFTGKPCSKGHVAERFVLNAVCLPCAYSRKQQKYATDPNFKAKYLADGKTYFKGKYDNDIEFRTKKKSKRTVYAKKQYATDPEFRDKRRTYGKERYDPDFAAKKYLHRKFHKQATLAAKLLTETLGIPHTIVKMEDGTFQPVANAAE